MLKIIDNQNTLNQKNNMSFVKSITSQLQPYAEDTINTVKTRMQERKARRQAKRQDEEQHRQEDINTEVTMDPETEAGFQTWLSSVVDSTNQTLPINNPEQFAQSESQPVALPEIATPIEGSTRRRGWWAKDMQHWTPEQMKAVLDHYGQEGLRENTYNYLRRRVNNSKTEQYAPKWEKEQESIYGGKQVRGIRNNNWGNIRISSNAWQGKVSNNTDGSFEQFESPEYGVRAMAITLRNYYKKYKLNTIEGLISRWAPNNENNTAGYIKSVSQLTGVGAREDISDRLFNDDEFMFKLLKAIAIKENGGDKISSINGADDIISRGLALANKR